MRYLQRKNKVPEEIDFTEKNQGSSFLRGGFSKRGKGRTLNEKYNPRTTKDGF